MSTDLMWDIGFSGSAIILGNELHVDVFRKDGRTAVLSLEKISTDITLSQLFDQFFGGIGLSWPSEIVDLSLTDSTIFYSYVPGTDFPSLPGLPQPILAQQHNVSGEGLFITTDISVELARQSISASGFITVIPKQGFKVAATLTNPINIPDASIFSVTAPNGSSQAGPSLELQSFDDNSAGTKRHFTLDCGYVLAGSLTFPESRLTVSTDTQGKPTLIADLAFQGNFGIVKNPTLTFTWDSANGFQIRLPFLSLHDLPIEFAKLLNAVSQANCNAAIGLVLKDVPKIQTRFVVRSKLSTAGGSLAVAITGSYTIGAEGHPIPWSVKLPQLTFDAPSDFSFDGIVDQIPKQILKNGEAVVQALWNNKRVIAVFLALFATQEALQAAIKELSASVCQDLGEQLQEFENNLEPTKTPTDPPKDPSDPGTSGGSGGVNIGGVIGTIGSGVAAIGKFLGKPGGGGCGGNGNGDDSPPIPPPGLAFAYIPFDQTHQPNHLEISWAYSTECAGYDLQFVDANKQARWVAHCVGETIKKIILETDPLSLTPGVCALQVRAYFGMDSDDSYTDWNTVAIVKLKPPPNVVMTMDANGEGLTVEWDSVSYAEKYLVAIRNLGGYLMATDYVYQPKAPARLSYEFTENNPSFLNLINGSFNVIVTAVNFTLNNEAISSDSIGVPVSKLPSPHPVTQSVTTSGLRVSWPAVRGTTRYRIRVAYQSTLGDAFTPVEVQSALGLIERDLRFDQFVLNEPGEYVTSVTALGDATHIASSPTSATAVWLFEGIGFMQIGTTFTVS